MDLEEIKKERFDLKLREKLGENVKKELKENLDRLIKIKLIRRTRNWLN